ncbi:MAG: hypothetical protein FJ010_08115 [Chloroflexi bacterium]|nr:hypothetical protein [Chloroflexota bacterium]
MKTLGLSHVALILVAIILACFIAISPSNSQAASETLTAPYLMAFHACETGGAADCHDPRNHRVYLAQSADGVNWSIVPGWQPFPGSVPDVIRRGETLYLYTPGRLTRYHLDTNTLDPSEQVEISGLQGGYVDPSLILDDTGQLALFFLYGQPGSDPAGCAPSETSCLRQIGSATEVLGSNGAAFTLDDGQRASMTIDPSLQIKSFSDPDIFFNGDQYVLYISHGPSTSVWVSKELRGEYVLEPGLLQGMLALGIGGVPAGYFDPSSGQYWTYAHIDRQGQTVIRRAVHDDLFHPLDESEFGIVISGESLGLGANFSVASPGFAVNHPDDNEFTESTGQSPGGQPGPEFESGGPPISSHNAFTDQVYYATSSDGLNWSAGALLSEKASVPDVMRAADGALWAYWVDFSYMAGPNMERIGIARSTDDGITWEMLGNVYFTSLGSIVPVDPDVVELSDGRFRMYIFDISVHQLSHPIYSAVSENGLDFTLEEGVRLWMEDIYDPDVIQLPDGSYRMYVNSGDILSAASPDGLIFTADEGVRVENGSVPGSIVMPDGSIRMYNCARGISVYESQNGLDFNLLKEGIIRDESSAGQIICDPSVTALDDGYLIVYKTNPGQ